MRLLLAILVAAGCAGSAPAPPGSPPGADRAERGERSRPHGERKKRRERQDSQTPLFPERKTGWNEVSAAGRRDAGDFAAGYAEFLGVAKTPRRAARALVELAAERGFELLAAGARPSADRFCFVARGGDAAACVRAGERPLAEGVRVVVAAVDAPRIDLKQAPVHDAAGFAMLHTFLYGELDLPSWLSHPLALHVYVSRERGGDLDLAIGEDPGDPVLAIPDLLPHLSRKVQRGEIVDSPERMNAIAASSRRELAAALRRLGIDEGTLAEAEAYLVPAGPPAFVGVDRALLAGYGHRDRALAYAALLALADAERLEQTSIVIAISKMQIGGTGSTGLGFVRSSLARAVGLLSREEPDVRALGRVLARSAVLVSAPAGGDENAGLAFNLRFDDSLPAAARPVIDRMRAAGAQVQIASDGDWRRSPARELGDLDADVVEIGLPIRGAGAPRELLSILDLHQAFLALRAWLAG